jgi:hypothetical protein
MNNDPQALARQFNEAEAVWRRFEEKRRIRRLVSAPSPLGEEVLDALDWSTAEREQRHIRAIGVSAD